MGSITLFRFLVNISTSCMNKFLKNEDKDWKPKTNPTDKILQNIWIILLVISILMFVIGAIMMLPGVDDGTGTGAKIFFMGIIIGFVANLFNPN